MNCEEYIIEKLQKLEKENEHLKKIVDIKDEVINILNSKVRVLYDLSDKTELEFKDYGNYCTINFYGFHSTITDEGKENIKEIVNDLKFLGIYPDIVEAFEKEEND